MEVKQGRKTMLVGEDDHLRPDTTLERWKNYHPLFAKIEWSPPETRDGANAVVIHVNVSRKIVA